MLGADPVSDSANTIRLRDDHPAAKQQACRAEARYPIYIAHKGFRADDGERVTIVEFEHEEGQRAWRTHPEHIEAQKLGRSKYYEMYDIKVCNVTYDQHYERKKESAAGA